MAAEIRHRTIAPARPVAIEAAPVLVASHERSGTHLLIDLLRRQFPSCRARAIAGRNPHDTLYLSLDRLNAAHHRPMSVDEARRALAGAPRLPLKTHNLPAMDEIDPPNRPFVESLLERSPRLYSVRDGRDVMCSFQRFRQSYDPSTPGAISEFIRLDVDGRSLARRWADHVRAWTAHDRVHLVRFEDVIHQTRDVLERLADEIGARPELAEPLLPPRRATRVQNWFARLTGRAASTNVVGRRTGLAPLRWREAFSREDRRFFHREAGDILIELGYESDDGWTDA